MYARDLAYIHHHGFGDFAQQAAPGLLRILRDACLPRALVFDLLIAEGNSPMAYRGWRQAADWAVLFEALERRRGRWLTRDITTFRRTAHGFRRTDERHWLRLHRASEITRALVGAGFSVRL